MKDYHSVLGVPKTATADEIKAAYRKLAMKHHPDRNQGSDANLAEEKFKEVKEAYEALSTPYPAPESLFQQYEFGGNHEEFREVFREMFSQAKKNKNSAKPESVTYTTTVVVTPEEIYYGKDKLIVVSTLSGAKHTVKIKVPKTLDPSAQVKYNNVIANAALVVSFAIDPTGPYEIRGTDLYSKHEISILDLITGTSFQFKTISGKTLEVSVNPLTNPNAMLRIPKEGMPNGTDFGSQIITLVPVMPATIDASIIDAIKSANN